MISIAQIPTHRQYRGSSGRDFPQAQEGGVILETGGPAPFPSTRLSVVERIRNAEPEIRREAFGVLAAGYWKPIYAYLRLKWTLPKEDAEDIAQGFLASAFEKQFFETYDPGKAKFRTFLRMCLDRFVQNHQKAARALKRGGGATMLSLDFETAEGDLRTHEPSDAGPEEFFRRELIRDLFARSVDQVREEFERRGQQVQFEVFQRYDLDASDSLTYADLANALNLTVSQVTNALAAVRRAFRAQVLTNLEEISGTSEEFRLDARDLFGIDVT
jgi:DNA-directed RNA polymerase specialized sigma24 family protein